MKNLLTAFLLLCLTVTTSLSADFNFERIICGSSTVSAGTTRNYVTLSHVDETFDWSVSGNATLTSPPNSMNATIRFNSIGSATVTCVTSTGEVMTKVVTITSNSGGGSGSGGLIDF
jgi:hypothetical protein